MEVLRLPQSEEDRDVANQPSGQEDGHYDPAERPEDVGVVNGRGNARSGIEIVEEAEHIEEPDRGDVGCRASLQEEEARKSQDRSQYVASHNLCQVRFRKACGGEVENAGQQRG